MAVHPPNPKYIPKPYEQMTYPGQRIQVDVKFVPSACLKNSAVIGKQFFQYTAIDEYSRWRFVEAFEEHNTYSSARFLEHLVKAFPVPIECVQTDNGTEFTNRFTSHRNRPTLFQARLAQHGITHKLIRPYTPRHNGKVERSHRKDNERFYATHLFYSFGDFAKQLQVYNRRDYNRFPMRPLGWKSPQQVLDNYLLSL
uniref:DDE-type integrase/transposase/recombinase n=1 Tax=Enterocloster asparagiformis TaxID=333367 RepID=UPI0036F297FD